MIFKFVVGRFIARRETQYVTEGVTYTDYPKISEICEIRVNP